MSNIEIKNCVYKVHSVYNLYAASEAGDNIVKRDYIGNKQHDEYMKCMVRKYSQKNYKTYYSHRFIWECFNGQIPDDKVIDHINNKKYDNRLCNLQLVTPSENSKKAAQNRDHTFLKNSRRNKKCVKATNINTKEVSYFNSMNWCEQHLSVNRGNIKKVFDGVKYRKSCISKKDGCSYRFEYVKKEDMPDNYKKSANIRPKMSDEDKKKHQMEAIKRYLDKEYICPRCDKVMKNNNKSYHNKRCK